MRVIIARCKTSGLITTERVQEVSGHTDPGKDGRMEAEYPVFIIDSASSVRMVSKPAQLSWYEKIDIEEGEYSGWDVCGRPLRVLWESGVGPDVELTDESIQLNQLRAAIKNHAQTEVPNMPLACDESCDDVVNLFRAVERHIEANRPSLMKRMRRLFRGKA